MPRAVTAGHGISERWPVHCKHLAHTPLLGHMTATMSQDSMTTKRFPLRTGPLTSTLGASNASGPLWSRVT
jgi:hypothetical protein